MMGKSHVATGALAGVAAAGLLPGVGPVEFGVAAAVGAGAALWPDIDHPSSSASTSAGVVSRAVCAAVRAVSRWAWAATRSGSDDGGHRDGAGAHRHATHTVVAAVASGVAAGAVSVSPAGAGAVAAVAVAVALRGAGWRGGLSRWAVAFAAGGAVFVAAPDPWLVGVAAGSGWLVHILGDWLTPAGVPLAWPLKHRGKRWWMWRSPLAFKAGDCWQETCVRWGCWAGTPALAFALH